MLEKQETLYFFSCKLAPTSCLSFYLRERISIVRLSLPKGRGGYLLKQVVLNHWRTKPERHLRTDEQSLGTAFLLPVD